MSAVAPPRRSRARVSCAVVRQEELLQRRPCAQEVTYAGGGKYAQQGLDRSADLAMQRPTLDVHLADSGDVADIGWRLVECGFYGERRQVAHLGERADLEQLACAQDRDPVAQGFDFAQDV